VNAPRPADALLVGAAKLVTSALVLSTGFRAVSDDDYARLVIAQRFAESPSLDPSGTSWLPVPFWIYGSAFSVFGGGLGVARATALVLGVFSVLCVWVAAGWLGANRRGALAAALLAGVFDWSAWLGAAVLPEAPAAGLVVLGLGSLASREPDRRWVGAVALAGACLSRYEAWPVAAVFSVFQALDARRRSSWSLAVPALVAVSPIALWLAHGVVRHDDALFFWHRVASYKRALGVAPGRAPWLDPLVALAARGALLAATAFALAYRAKILRESLAPFARGFLAASALVAFLVVGSVGGAAPTHHAERALLPVFFFLFCVLGRVAGSVLASPRWYNAAAVALIALYPWKVLSPPSDFAHRELELHIGSRARELGAPALVVDTADYGHLAVTAAFGRPRASAPLDDHDPRKARAADAFASLEALRARARAAPNAWFVVRDEHAALAANLGTVRARNASFTLVEPAR
jgi:4-amino-4-deoxy-L-arabinose transferase-like glycosyltransferase